MSLPYIINIQRFSIHDGEGIRTTVFFKGCPLSCAWCHNPESKRFPKELLLDLERCTGCGACRETCPQQAILWEEDHPKTNRSRCTACGACTARCMHRAREVVGAQYSVQELVKKLLRDRIFYESSNGGVTLSGGEVMAQDPLYITELARRLFLEGVSVNIDTCGDVPYEHLEAVRPYVDCFLYDSKAFTPEVHLRWMGRDNRRILENLKRLSDAGAKIHLRLPIVGVNSSDEEMQRTIQFLQQEQIHLVKINLLPYHKVGFDKNERLGREDGVLFLPPSEERMQELLSQWQRAQLAPVLIGG